MTSRMPRLETVTACVLLALALALRLASLDAFIVGDELRWTCRSLGFRDALKRGDWAGTYRTGHPGVVTTWLGAVFIPHNDDQAQATCRASEDAAKLQTAGATPAERARLAAELGRMLFRGRVGVALYTWLCISAMYLLIRMLWGPGLAVLTLALVTLDPFYLALSRFLHVDGVLASTMACSVLSLLGSTHRRESAVLHRGLLLLSGAAGGLAILEKSPAIFLVPFAFLLLGTDVLRRRAGRETILQAARDLAIWCLVAGVVCIGLWPAMWHDPVDTAAKVQDVALLEAMQAHSGGNFFLGQPLYDPGWRFYPVAGLFRLSPLVLIGLICALLWLAKGNDRHAHRFDLTILLLYGALFGVSISMAPKKFDRYLLPAFPALDIVAAVGLLKMAEAVRGRMVGERPRGHARPTWVPVCLVVFVVGVALLLSHYPYYLTYYNPLMGGSRQARKTLLVGWGEGLDRAAAYLNAKRDAGQLQVIVPTVTEFAPLFSGETRSMREYPALQSDYVIFYVSHAQRHRYLDLLDRYLWNPRAQAEHVVTLHGIDYAWIYAKTEHVQD